MAKETATKETYKGVCNFCHAEVDKSKMTQHLKYCKERKASIEAEAAKAAQSQKPRKTKLFQILVEGTYLPMYWMYLELPALYTLYDLDDFLRDTWLECCGHLSAFKIGKTSYLSQAQEDIYGGFSLVNTELEGPDGAEGAASEEEYEEYEEEDEEDEEDNEEFYGDDESELEGRAEEAEEQNLAGIDLQNMSPREMVQSLNTLLSDEFQTSAANMPVEEFKERFLELIEKRLQAEAPEGESEGEAAMPPEVRKQLEQVASALHTMFQFPLLADFVLPQEQDMGYELRGVLKVGDKFSYEYDFGSTTDLRLRVISEREGYFWKSEDPVRILARNLPPVIPCRECGKPATKIEPGYFSAWEGALCDRCAKKVGDVEWFLPVVNSPRTGVCGYTG